MCTLPEPAKSMTPMVREKKTFGLSVPQATLKGESQPCTIYNTSVAMDVGALQ